jgi:glycine/D-amino acid oxidase-like deaminating enzyme/nitrite reductase/ring-hydroxylating ferredoxin subunit
MTTKSERHVETMSYWIESASLPGSPRLDRDGHADVVIVGAGITGLTAACLLASAGKSVVVLERAHCAEVDTGHTTAHLTMVTDTRLTELVGRFGGSHAQAVWDAGLAAIAQIDALVRENDIDCGFAWVDGYLHTAFDESDPAKAEDHARRFRREAELATELGFDAEFLARVPFVGGPGIRFDAQARFHPRQYLAGLAAAIRAKGGRIYEGSAAGGFSSSPLSVEANGHVITCGDIVMATHNPAVGASTMARATLFQTKLALHTSYVVAGRAAKGQVPDALFWDTGDPYHYLRVEPRADHDLLILGGEDHKTGQVTDTGACYTRLARKLQAMVPGVEITHRWSGQVIETPDGLPYIGPTAEHQFAATGFSGNGMTFGTMGAMIATDAILGRVNPWAELFAPERKALGRGLWEYIKENADYPYYLIRDRFAGAESRSLRSVKRGEGRIIEHNGSKVAAHRDESGALALRSAMCTHMGCVVGWNPAERTWDCPCHGSRFKPDGAVISGPAESPLAEV